MATYTSKLNLKKPESTEDINIADINGNMDTIDSQYELAYISATQSGNVWTGGSITAYKKNGIVMVKFANVSINAVNERTTIATLPSGWRPAAETSFIADRSTTKMFLVSPDGSIKADPQNAGSSIYGGCIFITT